MIYNEQSPQRYDASLPQSVAVVVIGGGIIGAATAWYLCRAGHTVLLCEKGRIAGEQSSRNWGWVRQQGRDAAELPIMMESNRIWQRLGNQIGHDVGFRQHGVLYIAESEEEMRRHEEWQKLAASHGLESILLGSADIRQRIAALRGNWWGGVITPSDGRAEPSEAVPALVADCFRRGVTVVENCAVRCLEKTRGAVSAVITEKGAVRCDSVVLAGGAWSSIFLGNQNIRFPQLTVKSTVARTAQADEIFPGNASLSGLAFRRRCDGGYTIAPSGVHEHLLNQDSLRFAWPFRKVLKQSWHDTRLRMGVDVPGGRIFTTRWKPDQITPFERQRVLNPKPDPGLLKLLNQRFSERIPSLAGVPLVEAWAGMIDATPDVVPVIDAVEGLPGLFLGSGFSGHGFGIGPAAGRILADLVQGNPPGHDMDRFRFGRFSDGTPICPGPAL